LSRGEGRFRALPEAAVAADPAVKALNDLRARMRGEADLIRRLAHDLNCDD